MTRSRLSIHVSCHYVLVSTEHRQVLSQISKCWDVHLGATSLLPAFQPSAQTPPFGISLP